MIGNIGLIAGWKIIESVYITQDGVVPVELMSRTRKHRGIKLYRHARVPLRGVLRDDLNRIIYVHPAIMDQLRREII